MPGIVGCLSHQTLNPKIISAMIQPMLHRSSYRTWKKMEQNFGIATIDLIHNRQNDSIESSDGRFFLVFVGALYEPWINGNGIASKLLKRWNEGGWKSLADLNGEYLIAIWDRTEERLTIINDRLGLKRLNYWQKNGSFAFASEVKSLAVLQEVSVNVNEEALSELLTFGHLQDDRTLLQDIKLLPSASCLIWQNGKINITQYWDYVYKADPAFTNHERAVDEYFYHTKNAVEKRIQSRSQIGLFLSGGLDSRTLAGIIPKINSSIELLTWTAGHGHDHDTRYAQQIAKVIGSKHISIDLPKSFLDLYASEYSWVLDGAVSTHGSHRSCLIDEAAQKVDLVLLGYMGDTASGGKPLDYVYPMNEMNQLVDKGFAIYSVGFNDSLLKKTLRQNVYEKIKGLAFDSFRKSVERAKVEFLADRIVYSELVQRQRLFNPPAQMDLQSVDCYWSTPFSDKDFIDFSLRLPWQERLSKKAYIGMLCKYFPKLARIPRSGDGLPLAPSRLRASLHWRWILFQRNTLPKLTAGRFGGHNYGAFVHCSEWFRKSSATFIRSKLINNPILEEQFRMDELNQMVESFLNHTAEQDLMECIAALMSYVLFYERLIALPRLGLHEIHKSHPVVVNA